MAGATGMSSFRRLPGLALVALLAVLTMRSWLESGPLPLVLHSPAAGMSGIAWSATVAGDGRLAVQIVYDFDDAEGHEVDIRLPAGARYLALNGTPLSASSGLYASATVTDAAVVSYELPGAVTRYRDGALLRLASVTDTTLDDQQGLFACPRCYIDGIDYGDSAVSGSISVPGVDASGTRLQIVGLRSIRTEATADAIRFVGIDDNTDAVSMLAILPDGSATGLPRRDGSVAEAVAAARADLRAAGETVHVPHPAPTSARWASITLTVLLGAVIAWMFRRLVVARDPVEDDLDTGPQKVDRLLRLMLLPLTIAMGLVALIGARDGVVFVWFTLILGPLLAAAAIVAGAPSSRPAPPRTSTRR